jgi:hypothetical protein
LQIEVLSGIASFERIRHRHHDDAVFLYAFDLIELDGDNLWRNPLEVRKATLANVIAPAAPGIRLNEHIEEDGPIVFQHASSAWKASSPSARIPATDPDVRHIGSSQRIRHVLRWRAKQKKTGDASLGCHVSS